MKRAAEPFDATYYGCAAKRSSPTWFPRTDEEVRSGVSRDTAFERTLEEVEREEREEEERQQRADRAAREAETISSFEERLAECRSSWRTARFSKTARLVVSEKLTRLLIDADAVEGCRAWRKSFVSRTDRLAAEVDAALAVRPVEVDRALLLDLMRAIEESRTCLMTSNGVGLDEHLRKAKCLLTTAISDAE